VQPRGPGLWVALACLVVIASPLVQGLTVGAGFSVAAVLAGVAMGGIVMAVYLRTLKRTRRGVDR
jgi:hypothetical protein